MKAVILAGGYGKRLMPLTSRLPKPLLEVGGKPIIDWQISWLKRSGVGSFVVTCGYLKEKLISHLDVLKKDSGIEVEYAIEKSPLGTGGALKNSASHIDEEEFIAVNGDVITNLSVKKLKLGKAMASLALTRLKSPFGIVKTENAVVSRFDEKPYIKGYWINAGVYRMRDGIFSYLPEKGDIERTAFATLAARRLLIGVKYDGVYWRSIDSLKDLEDADKELRGGVLRA